MGTLIFVTGLSVPVWADKLSSDATGGKSPYAMSRLYGPTDAFFDRSFKLPDVELVA